MAFLAHFSQAHALVLFCESESPALFQCYVFVMFLHGSRSVIFFLCKLLKNSKLGVISEPLY